jgi:hypothetical protein
MSADPMPVCPAGHQSAASDYCEVCGLSMSAPSLPSSPSEAPPSGPCPQCGAPRLGRFCEVCGYEAGAQHAARTVAAAERSPDPGDTRPQTRWTAVIAASRSYFETVLDSSGIDASTVPFPDDYPERRIPLAGGQLRIGRRSVSREVAPEIDLTGPPADPAISRLHAVLVAQPDGSWAIIDPGSENGTSVNGTEVPVGDLVPLHNGDRVNVGAWTAITIVGEACN